MAKLAIGTVVAKNYVPFARVLAHSLRQHHPDISLFVALADEVDGYFDPAAEPFQLVTLADLRIPDLTRFTFHYSRRPLVVATKSYLLSYLLDRGFGTAIFLDADILVLRNLDALFKVAREHAILPPPHLRAPLTSEDRAPRELNILLAGTYNGGSLAVSDTAPAREFLAWWQDRLYDHCLHAVDQGMHYDQHWLDLVPVYFEGVHILRDPGYNVAYWGLPERNSYLPQDQVALPESCRFFHFSGFDPEQPPAVTRYSPRLTMSNVGPAVSLFDRYANLLSAAGYYVSKKWPYAYGSFDNGVAIPKIARQICRDLADSADQFGDPFRAGGPQSFFRWLNQPIDTPDDPSFIVTNLWKAIYGQRPDVQV